MGMHMGGGGRAARRLISTFDADEMKTRKTDPQTVRRVAKAFKPYKWQVLLVLISIVLISLLGLINPYMLKLIIDDAWPHPGQVWTQEEYNKLTFYVLVMIVMPILSGIIGVGQTYLNNLIGQHVMRDFRNTLYTHLQKMSMKFFTSTRTGEIQSRLSNDIGGVEQVVTNTASSILSNLTTAISTVAAMFFISWPLTVLSLCLLPLFLWLTYRVGRVRRVLTRETQKTLADMSALVEETLSVSGVLLTKTFGRQSHAVGRFAKENNRLTELEINQQMLGRWFMMFVSSFFSIIPALVYFLAGYLGFYYHSAPITVGTIVAFTTLQSRLFFPIGQLLNVQVDLQGALALFDRIFEYLDIPIDISDAPDAIDLDHDSVKGAVEFKDVTFKYIVSQEALTLNDISFAVNPGEMVALVGPSGAGKTTTSYLVSRLYDVDAGSVTIDGVDVRRIKLESLGLNIGVVTQEPYLFHSSIKENLIYSRPEATEEEMIAAAKAAAIHERIMELPQGYDTIVGERGYKLSGGEKQRLAIARVVLKDPKILILDEATSSLDTLSERLIQSALGKLMQNRTTIAIAHRLSTILSADQILVINHGQIVERGKHLELLEINGLYARIYHEQFESDQMTRRGAQEDEDKIPDLETAIDARAQAMNAHFKPAE